ncbi:MAG TPA: SDR family NAD(P)-dependent oxidoreductase [Polyangiaceae bacterium]|nr:SDR family NAD(P)-dependent oxidoreductase [Polyangiaceae bacterium]
MSFLVTGASGALGSALARTLVARGASVTLLDRAQSHERVEALRAELGERAAAESLEAPTAEAYAAAIARVEARGPIEGAALIAGGWAGGAPLHETSPEIYESMVHANLDTVYFALHALLPGMVARKGGSIVVVGSRNVERPWTGARGAAYTASKAGAVAMAQAAAAEVLEHGVRINAVLPSTMDTPQNRAGMPKADFSRWVTTGSAASVIAFLLSEDARDVSGAAIPVYGRA